MDRRLLALLCCPRCEGSLGPEWRCLECGTQYAAPGGIPDLRLRGDERTERVRQFYSAAPFPGYPPNATLEWLRARAGQSRFARLLDEAIAPEARVVEVGCGTGQMSLYLAARDRLVVGVDLTRESLQLGVSAARRFGIGSALFVETDLSHAGLRAGSFDVVYCSGVLHHTPDPRAAFAKVARLARPGGIVLVGVYNWIARLPTRVRRIVVRLSGGRWTAGDRVLSDRAGEADRHRAWLRDQYCHPEEHHHSLGEVRRWLAENDIEYLRSYPSAMLDREGEDENLFKAQSDDWWLEAQFAQIGWIWRISAEGGLFLVVGRRKG